MAVSIPIQLTHAQNFDPSPSPDGKRLVFISYIAGKEQLFEQLREFLTERPDEADYARVAAALNLRRNTLAVAVHRLRHRLRELIRAELVQTTVGSADLESEIRELRNSLGAAIG